MTAATNSDYADAIDRIHAESQGFLRLWFVKPEDGMHLTVASLCGDPWATGLLRATAQCAMRVMRAPRRKPSLCLCCPRAVRRLDGVMFCVAVPEVEHPEQALGAAVCPRCADAPDMGQRAIQAFRCIWPNIREIQVMPGSETVQ